MKALTPKKFLSEFCGQELKSQVLEVITPVLTSEQLDNIQTKSKDETFLLCAFILDWFCIRHGYAVQFFKTEKWFWYADRKIALPAEALPGLMFKQRKGDALDFEYVHLDVDRTGELDDPRELPRRVGAQLRAEVKSLLEFGLDFDTLIWKIAKASYPVYMFGQAKEFMWVIDFSFIRPLYSNLSSPAKSLDGKVDKQNRVWYTTQIS
jgi:hypothetical protein